MSEAGKSSPGGADFAEFRKELEDTKGIQFFSRVEDVPPVVEGIKRLAIISAREYHYFHSDFPNQIFQIIAFASPCIGTSDNPSLFASCLGIGSHAIFLEKPGAPSVAELELMKTNANEVGAAVFMGFNKNVSKYVLKTRNFAKSHPGTNVTFLHNNNYDESGLNECFERNAEGMLKNMGKKTSGNENFLSACFILQRCQPYHTAIHELALAVSFYGVAVDNIASVVADKDFSQCLTLEGPSGQSFTDFAKIKFTIKTKDGNEVSIAADRCGGDDSVGIVTDGVGNELVRFTMPDDEDSASIKNAEERIVGAMPYFYVQSPDYQTLKERVASSIANSEPAEGVATIEVAVETLKVAEYLTPILIEQLKQ